MSNVAGQIYFIAEEPSITAPPLRVKIGLVRESKSGRDSHDRLLDHQTGNPRKLKLLEVVETARVSHVENSIHQRYASQRGVGEWFEMSDSQLQAAIAECRILASQQNFHLPIIKQAEKLKGLARSENIIEATEEAREWHYRYLVATASERSLKNLIDKYQNTVKAAHERGCDIARYARVTFPRISFGTWLKANHNDVYEACKQMKSTNQFDIVSDKTVKSALSGADAELSNEFAAKLDERTSEVGVDSLHQLHLQVRRPLRLWTEEKVLSAAYLKVFCGRDQSIVDICEWKTKNSNDFSEDFAEKKYPALHEKHTELEILGKARITLRSGGDSDIGTD
jgi:hypothetical protein